jgi:hypothetical protein
MSVDPQSLLRYAFHIRLVSDPIKQERRVSLACVAVSQVAALGMGPGTGCRGTVDRRRLSSAAPIWLWTVTSMLLWSSITLASGQCDVIPLKNSNTLAVHPVQSSPSAPYRNKVHLEKRRLSGNTVEN